MERAEAEALSLRDKPVRMSFEQEEATEAAADRRDRQSNRRMLVIVGLVTLAVIGWNLYVQLVGR